MLQRLTSRPLFIAAALVLLVALLLVLPRQPMTTSALQLLTDPFLQRPTADSVRVVWFTEFAGSRHTVAYGRGFNRTASATTTKLSRTREDERSRVGDQTEDAQVYKQPTLRDVWRHEAVVTGLTAGDRVPYQVTSVREDGKTISSNPFTLAPNPTPQTP